MAGAGTDDKTHTQVGFDFFTLYMCSTEHVWIIYTSNDCATISINTQTLLGLGVCDRNLEGQGGLKLTPRY